MIQVWSVGEDYILKAGDKNAMLKNLTAVKALATQGFSAVTPVSTKSGAE